jgi:hypothetical protein
MRLSPEELLSGLERVYLSGQAGYFPGRGAPMERPFGGYMGDDGSSLLQRSFSFFHIFLDHGLAHVPHQVFDSGFSGSIAGLALFVLAGPFHGGKVSGQITSSEG